MFINRFTINTCGAMTFTGNTLGLGQQFNQNNAGTDDSIGAFITLDTSQPGQSNFPLDPDPVGGIATTTLNINLNSSAAILVIPAGSTVLYAELIWGGNYLSRNEDLTTLINNNVILTAPNGSMSSITPDPVTANEPTFPGNPPPKTLGFYMRSSNVTNIIQMHGAGEYSVGQVTGLTDRLNNSTDSTNHAGWTLAVIYQNLSLPFRNMTLFVGAQGVVNIMTNPIIDVNVAGFSTPSAGAISARVLISAGEGDATKSGDEFLFGPDTASLSNLSGSAPNNPAMNFFGSQIEDDNGAVDMSGTYGSRNQTPGTPGVNMFAGRQGWDIANVDASNALINNQNSGVFRFTTTEDEYLPNAIGLQIDLDDSILNLEKKVDQFLAHKGDVITYTSEITNPGPSIATNVIFTDIEPIGTDFIENSVSINGTLQPGEDPNAGILIGQIGIGDTVIVQFRVRVTTGKCFVTNDASVSFNCDQTVISNQVLTTICNDCLGCPSCSKKPH
ncbi:DUF11 domain-containing protein [Chengkuizengella sp. SCS-71B]|uniref:DUF11 domain-containing protein n=1 Tax=Chengkuizengella sp. SCS-71B TaxID=3115290 RepID=UPI0032C20EA0